MDIIKLIAYQELLKIGKMSKNTVYEHVLCSKITPEDYKQITNEECPELPLENIKANKKRELWLACNATILFGFYSSASGEEKLFGFDELDQSNLQGQMILLAQTTEPITWKVKGVLEFVHLSREQFLQLALDAQAHKVSNMQKYFTLCGILENVTAKEQLENISWDMVLN